VPDVVVPVRRPQHLVWFRNVGVGVDLHPTAADMTVDGHRIWDWTYRDARLRLVRAGRARLPEHVAVAALDDDGNRLVECGCGWRGNGIGWAAHIDSVVRAALDPGPPS